jgi:CspA family cold shock protein
MNIEVSVKASEPAELVVDEAGFRAVLDGDSVVGIVKWFRADKGYGFIDLGDGQGDVFLHAKVLRGCRGLETAPLGATIHLVMEDGPRGRQATRVLDVDASTSTVAVRAVRPEPAEASRRKYDLASTTELTGKVKWFDDVRGFGFVAGDDFGRDVFVHCSIFHRTGVARLAEGQAVAMRVIETVRGREAVEITTF